MMITAVMMMKDTDLGTNFHPTPLLPTQSVAVGYNSAPSHLTGQFPKKYGPRSLSIQNMMLSSPVPSPASSPSRPCMHAHDAPLWMLNADTLNE